MVLFFKKIEFENLYKDKQKKVIVKLFCVFFVKKLFFAI